MASNDFANQVSSEVEKLRRKKAIESMADNDSDDEQEKKRKQAQDSMRKAFGY